MRTIEQINQDLRARAMAAQQLTSGTEEMAAAKREIEQLMSEREEAEAILKALDAANAKATRTAEEKAGRRFSFVKLIRDIAETGHPQGLEAEICALGAEEARAYGRAVKGVAIPSCVLRDSSGQNYSTAADGGNLVQTAPVNYLEALRERLQVRKLGAKFMGDLVGTVPFVTGSNLVAAWLTEGAAPSAFNKIQFDKATMYPHRLQIKAAFSRELVKQTSLDVEALVRNELVAAHAAKLEEAAIKGSGTSGEPLGILSHTGIGSVAIGTNGGPITWAKAVELETAVADENAASDNMAYLTNARVRGAMKTTAKASNTATFICERNEVNGYPCAYTRLVPHDLSKGTSSGVCSAMIFGDFGNLYIGDWGGIEILVDPFTLADNGDIKVSLFAFNDVLVARPKAFAAIKDITTA